MINKDKGYVNSTTATTSLLGNQLPAALVGFACGRNRKDKLMSGNLALRINAEN